MKVSASRQRKSPKPPPEIAGPDRHISIIIAYLLSTTVSPSTDPNPGGRVAAEETIFGDGDDGFDEAVGTGAVGDPSAARAGSTHTLLVGSKSSASPGIGMVMDVCRGRLAARVDLMIYECGQMMHV